MGDRALYVGGGLFGGVETGVVEGDLREPYSVVGEYIENVTEVVGGYPAQDGDETGLFYEFSE